MATISAPVPSPERSALQLERTFYFRMSLIFLAAAVAGFGFFFAIGASSFDSPWWVHTHALMMSGFLGLYIVQNWLVQRGDIAAHRRLGIIGAIWSVWLVAFSCWAITRTIALGRIAPFFTPNFFLAMDWLNMAVFAALAGAALRLRNRSDWHKRLMFGAMLSLMSVAWGRLVLPQFFDQRAIVLVLVVLLGHLGAAMLFDRRAHGRVHPAHYWTASALVGWIALTFIAADLPPVVGLAQSFTP
jgi:hypothetical protein